MRERLVVPQDLATLGGSTSEHLPGYLGMVKRLDEAFGRLVEALYSLKLLDDTIILFTSDHGCHFKTRNDEYKRSCHEASIRVPTLFHGPGFAESRCYDGLVSLIDLPPTLLDAAGIEVPATMQGRSVLENGAGGLYWRTMSSSRSARAMSRAPCGRGAGNTRLRRQGRTVGTRWQAAATWSRCSTILMPIHMNSLISSRRPRTPAVRAELRRLLLERIAAAGEEVPEIVAHEEAGLAAAS